MMPVELNHLSARKIKSKLLLNNSDTIATINGYVDEDGLKSFLSTNVKVGE